MIPLCDKSGHRDGCRPAPDRAPVFFGSAVLSPLQKALGLALLGSLVVSLPATAALAQSESSPQSPSPSVSPSAPATAAPVVNLFPTEAPPEYRVGPGDVLGITVFNMPQLDRTTVVGSNGALQLSYFTQPLIVKDETAQQIEQQLSAELKRSQILLYPQVDVAVTKVESKPVMVGGDVKNPQILQEIRPITLLDALMLAGGPQGDASNSVLVTRAVPGSHAVSYDLPLSKVLSGTNTSDNMAIQPGDTIQVLPGEKVFVAGDVKTPGAFNLERDQQLTVAKIMALSGGWKPDASPKKAVIVREGPNGQRVTVPVNLPKIMARKENDIALESNDLLYVPGSAAKTVGLAAAEGVGQAAAWAIGYMIIGF